MENRLKNKVHLLPNVVTAFGLSCGLFVIFKMNLITPGEATLQTLMATAGILLLAALADVLDGAIARAIKAESDFGGLFDSLADAITFGLAPPVIVLKALSLPSGTTLSFCVTSAAMIYAVCGVLRLVRFNILSAAPVTNAEEEIIRKKHFTGLPIPAAAAALVSANLFLFSNEAQSLFSLSITARGWTLFTVMLLLGYFMISLWKFPSVKTLHIRLVSFQQVIFTVIFAVFIFYGLLHHFAVVFALASWLYITIAWCLSLARVISGRRLQKLEEFEPDSDELED